MIEINGVEYKAISNLYLRNIRKNTWFCVSAPIDFVVKQLEETKEYCIYIRYTNFNHTFDYDYYSILFFLKDYTECLQSFYCEKICKLGSKPSDSYEPGFKLYYRIDINPELSSIFDIYQSFIPISMIELELNNSTD